MSSILDFAKQHKVTILATGSAVAGVAGVGWLCYNSIEHGDELKGYFNKLSEIRGYHDKGCVTIYNLETKDNEEVPYTDEMYRSDRNDILKSIGKWGLKNYALPSGLLLLSGAGVGMALGIEAKALTAATVSYNALATMYEGYKTKVAEKIGEDEEKKLRLGLSEATITEKLIGKDGKEKEVKKKVLVKEGGSESEYGDDIYVFWFDEAKSFNKESNDLNDYVLKCHMNAANQILKDRGYLFLNEVLIPLGFPPTKFGQYVGWTKDAKRNGTGDGHVDFRQVPMKREVNGQMIDTWMLDFNVDGMIIDSKWFDYKKKKLIMGR